MLIDTHAHIHDPQYKFGADTVLQDARAAGVQQIICIGTSDTDSAQAVKFVQNQNMCVATVGLHPHDAKLGKSQLTNIQKLATEQKVVAIGECGLDYYYQHSPKADQAKALQSQIELALSVDKPLVFHVRDAFDDFFRIIDKYSGINGVVHSFTADTKTLKEVLKRGLHVALNGIMTFTKDQSQLEAAKSVPVDSLLLETDSPFLTPVPHRGKPNQPANVKLVAEFLANLRGETFEQITTQTTANAQGLFKLSR